jgi:hypothetical protein
MRRRFGPWASVPGTMRRASSMDRAAQATAVSAGGAMVGGSRMVHVCCWRPASWCEFFVVGRRRHTTDPTMAIKSPRAIIPMVASEALPSGPRFAMTCRACIANQITPNQKLGPLVVVCCDGRGRLVVRCRRYEMLIAHAADSMHTEPARRRYNLESCAGRVSRAIRSGSRSLHMA